MAEAGEAAAAAAEGGGPIVGVLGWLAFTISHVAAWCLILISSSISCYLGLALCVGYTSVLMGGAVLLERRGIKYAAFVNVLWVLGCIFLFVSGVYLTRIAFGRSGGMRLPDELDAAVQPDVVATAQLPGMQQQEQQDPLPGILAPSASGPQQMESLADLQGEASSSAFSTAEAEEEAPMSAFASTDATDPEAPQLPLSRKSEERHGRAKVTSIDDVDVDDAADGVEFAEKRTITQPGGDHRQAKVEVWGDNVLARIQPDFATFQGALFFSALSRRPDIASREDLKEVNVLWYFDGERTVEVLPALLRPQNLLVFKEKLCFSAEGLLMDRQLYCIDGVGGSASLITPLIGKAGGRIHSLRLASAEPLLFQASFPCPDGTRKESLFMSDGTSRGTTELSAKDCVAQPPAPVPAPTQSPSRGEEERAGLPTAEMLAVLFLGDLPTLGVASWVLATKRIPGVSVNIFAGVWIAVTLLHGITAYEPDLLTFNKWFAALYSSLCYAGIICVHVIAKENNPWLEGLKAWLQPVVGITYFLAIHAILEIPFTAHCWRWLVYFALNLFQVGPSLFLHRMLPMFLALTGQFEVAWKLSREAARLLFGGPSGELAVLTMLALLALQGIGIVMAAVFYVGRREWIDGRMRDLIRGKRGSKLLGELERDDAM